MKPDMVTAYSMQISPRMTSGLNRLSNMRFHLEWALLPDTCHTAKHLQLMALPDSPYTWFAIQHDAQILLLKSISPAPLVLASLSLIDVQD